MPESQDRDPVASPYRSIAWVVATLAMLGIYFFVAHIARERQDELAERRARKGAFKSEQRAFCTDERRAEFLRAGIIDKVEYPGGRTSGHVEVHVTRAWDTTPLHARRSLGRFLSTCETTVRNRVVFRDANGVELAVFRSTGTYIEPQRG